jgi:hypothetical protein
MTQFSENKILKFRFSQKIIKMITKCLIKVLSNKTIFIFKTQIIIETQN